ncbi:SAM-dependent methyltransferase [Nannocystis punicea]|uniref:SAM-dependent methyltransferase n=1 Tax=Nannocystis punicea TaxID=2995304 RepID=A0ABY7H111_9BACT|nr:SAM-dependent methyltransferase [Nannocystis poenicansa]WAS92940.1 SAM-dependent methyltransferase [Nannocystis poenicansa]
MNTSTKHHAFDIAIVGLGVSGIHQMTREVEETIKRCRHVFVTDTAEGVCDYLRTICPKVTELTVRGDLGAHRMVIYRRMASEVISGALDEGPVCFATYGHPTMYCYPTELIQRAAQILDLRTMILPGVSSLDTLLSDLGIDPGGDGLQIYEASDMLIRQRPLQTDVGTVIYQVPIVLESSNRLPGKQSIDNLRRFQAYLLKYYPPKHTALFVLSKTHPLLETVTQRIPLDRLADVMSTNTNLGTLYIPPVQHRAVVEHELAERMGAHDALDSPRRPGRPAIGPKDPKARKA